VGRVILDDDANGLGWYSNLNAPVTAGKYDLYTVLLHEIGHTLGFTQAYGGFASLVEIDADGTTSFVGPDFAAKLDGTAQHLHPQANRNDLMNPELEPGVRKQPSVMDVQILQASYEAARAGATGFSTDAAALHVAAEPTALASEPLGQEDQPVQQAQAFLYTAVGDKLAFRLGSGSSIHVDWTFATGTDDELKTIRRFFNSALTGVQRDGPFTDRKAIQPDARLENSGVSLWHELSSEEELGDLLDELETWLTTESTSLKTLDAAFALWE